MKRVISSSLLGKRRRSGGGLLKNYTDRRTTSRNWSHDCGEQTGGLRGCGPKVGGTIKTESHSNERDLHLDIVFCPIAATLSCLPLPLLVFTLDTCGRTTPKGNLTHGSQSSLVWPPHSYRVRISFKALVLMETSPEKSIYLLRTTLFGPWLFLNLHFDVY